MESKEGNPMNDIVATLRRDRKLREIGVAVVMAEKAARRNATKSCRDTALQDTIMGLVAEFIEEEDEL